jgi:predicted nucleic acid-binding protein
MESVYLETSFISYLVARPSRDLLIAAHQQVTLSWWEQRRSLFANYVSQVVIDEASVGDAAEIEKRSAILQHLPSLTVTEDAETLTAAIMSAGMLPLKAIQDAAHVAVASVHSVNYLLTWNCKHLANARIFRRIALVCERLGFQMPTICTPEELLED